MSKIEKDNIALAITDGFISANDLKEALTNIYFNYVYMWINSQDERVISSEQADDDVTILRTMIQSL